jgi:23S rRNA (pseudouridine1915-N3)-methyltransferase
MKLLLISVGKKHDPDIAEAITDFTGRISKYAPVEWKFISPAGAANGGSDSARGVDAESTAVIAALADRDHVVLLDETGKDFTSVSFSKFLETRLNESTHRLVFIIGGAHGVNENVRAHAQTVMKLSSLVFPHQLVRLIIAEQIYRAFTILRGEKYHHA